MQKERTNASDTVQALLYLTGCAVNGMVPQRERLGDVDLDAVFALSNEQSLLTLTHYAVTSAYGGSFPQDEKLQGWDVNNQIITCRSLLMNEELTRLLDYLESNGIWYMPMKGAVLQDLYPTRETRQMGDFDVLFDRNHQPKVRQWFVDNGYEVEEYGIMHHDEYKKKPFFFFEMHVEMLGYRPGTKGADYYEDVKSRLIPDHDNFFGRHFSDEDLYIYVITHGCKHYVRFGIGIRFLIDCYLLQKHKGKGMDWEYVDREIATIGITDFEKKVRHLSQTLFAHPETLRLDELTQEESSFLQLFAAAGTHGNYDIFVRNKMQKSSYSQKIKYTWNRMFPERKFMTHNYPILRRHTWLLPAGYIYRLFHHLRVNREHLASEIRALRKF